MFTSLLLAFTSFGVSGVLGGLISLVVFILCAVLAIWLLKILLDAVGVSLPDPAWLLIKILIALVGLFYVLRAFGVA